jgi:hypothetical protein
MGCMGLFLFGKSAFDFVYPALCHGVRLSQVHAAVELCWGSGETFISLIRFHVR